MFAGTGFTFPQFVYNAIRDTFDCVLSCDLVYVLDLQEDSENGINEIGIYEKEQKIATTIPEQIT